MRAAAGLILAVLLLVACDDATPEPGAEEKPDNGPADFVTALYKTYIDYGEGAPQPGAPDMYSKRLQAMIDKDAAETPDGEAGKLDFNPIVDGQDWQLTGLKIAEVSRAASEAKVRATFANFGEPRSIVFNLVREDGQWRIDDITETLQPRWTLSKILSDAPDAFPDAEPEVE